MQALFKCRSGKVLIIAVITAMMLVSLGFTADYSYAAAKQPTKITLQSTASSVDIKGTVTVSVKSVRPSGASKAVTYKSSNSKIATVSDSGLVRGIKSGTVTITATSKCSKKVTASIKIKVKDITPTSVSLNKSKVTTTAGKSFTLKASVKPAGVYNKGITFSSSNTKSAVVDSKGTVYAKAPGTARITVKTKEGGKKAVCMVTVTDDNVLNGWVLTGYYRSSRINNTDIDSNASCQMWNTSSRRFTTVKKTSSNILGNYVQLYDRDADGDADLIHIVRYKDGADFWDAGMTWTEGAGNTEPYVSDEVGEEMFSQKFRIPMGERLLTTYGLGSWSGTTDFNNYENSPYWENTDYDYYTLDSSDTLTMLTNYRTALQTTGSTCVMTSALSVLEWYGVRGDLNERDLSSLRGEDRAGKVGGTSLSELKTVFKKLSSLGITGKWNMSSWESDQEKLYDPEWIQSELAKGHPIIVIWNSYGAHGQVIIGYDNMGTEQTNDDVLIMMDPYDTTDHNADGYIIQSYERLAYGLLTWKDTGTTGTHFLSVWPSDWDYTATTGDGMVRDRSNRGNFSDENKIPYGNTSADIKEYYPKTVLYDGILSGAAGVERSGDYDKSPYYTLNNYYGTETEVREAVGSDTLKILDNFKTIQQSTEWTCGVTSALMTITHFDKNQPRKDGTFGAGELETDVSLATHRENGKTGATHRDGMKEIFDYMNSEYDQDWVYFTNLDLDDPYGEESYIGDYCLQAGSETPGWDGLVPYLIDNNIPMMIGWDEWGGHWQTIIGYDSMGTEGTQDDVLILADSYDTTDHNQDGYVVESFERLVYGWNSAFETDEDGSDNYNDFIVAFPAEGNNDVIEALGLQ